MALKHKYDIVHTRKYTDKDGNEKKAYTNFGKVFERDDGSLCMSILDSWCNFYEPKIGEKEFKEAKHAVAKGNAFVDEDDSIIPF